MRKAAEIKESLQLLQGEPIYLSNTASTYLGTIRSSQPVYIKSRVFRKKTSASVALEECARAKAFKHANVCEVIDYYKERKGSKWEVTVVEERPGGSLSEEIEERRKAERHWSENEILTELFKLLRALSEAQQSQIAHRNITLDNIFLSPNGCKLGNFSLFFAAECKDLDLFELKYPGTLEYMSPELRDENASLFTDCHFNLSFDYYKSDIYSLGLVILSMSLLRFPSETQSPLEELLREVSDHFPSLPEILRQMLQPEASNRKNCQPLLVLMENRSLIPSTEGLKKCRVCKGLVYSHLWTQRITAEMRQYAEVLPELCGTECLERFHQAVNEVVTCAWCRCAVNLANIDVVPLLCGHYIHSRECLFQYMKSATVNFSNASKYSCPVCKGGLQGLENYFDGEALAEMKKTAYANSCHICHSSDNLTVIKGCRHILCEEHCRRFLWMKKCAICKSKV